MESDGLKEQIYATENFIAMYYVFAIGCFIIFNATLYCWINRTHCFKNCPRKYQYTR